MLSGSVVGGWCFLVSFFIPFFLLGCASSKKKKDSIASVRKQETLVGQPEPTPQDQPPAEYPVDQASAVKSEVKSRTKKGEEQSTDGSGLVVENNPAIDMTPGKTLKTQGRGDELAEDRTQIDMARTTSAEAFDVSLDESHTGEEEKGEEGAYAAGDWKGLRAKTALNEDVEVIFEPDEENAVKKGEGVPKEAIDTRAVNIEEQKEKAKYRLITFLSWLTDVDPGPDPHTTNIPLPQQIPPDPIPDNTQ